MVLCEVHVNVYFIAVDLGLTGQSIRHLVALYLQIPLSLDRLRRLHPTHHALSLYLASQL
jgi:hypothetical protein